MLKGHKYTFLKDYRKITENKKAQLNMLTLMYPKIGEAYRLKVMFDEFRHIKDMQEAQGYLAFWCDLVEDSKIHPLMEFA